MSTPSTEWREQFDKEFETFALHPVNGAKELTHNNVRDFIEKTLLQQRTTLKQEIVDNLPPEEEIAGHYFLSKETLANRIARNSYRQQTLEAIKKV